MKNSEKPRIDAVELDLNALLENPRAVEVILNVWIEDGSLPVPSQDLLDFLATDLLHGFKKLVRFDDAGTKGTAEAVREYVVELRGLSPPSRRRLIELAVARRRLMQLMGNQPHSLFWWPVLSVQESRLSETRDLRLGERRLMRLLAESMTFRSILLGDLPRLDGLGEAVRIERQNCKLKPKASEEIALMILLWHPYLVRELIRDPSRTEVEIFLRGVYPDISESPATWAEARKLIGVRTAESRSRRIDNDQINKLALKARKEGPNANRVPRWSIPPNRTRKEDLQK
jgi:hypothetical protein